MSEFQGAIDTQWEGILVKFLCIPPQPQGYWELIGPKVAPFISGQLGPLAIVLIQT